MKRFRLGHWLVCASRGNLPDSVSSFSACPAPKMNHRRKVGLKELSTMRMEHHWALSALLATVMELARLQAQIGELKKK